MAGLDASELPATPRLAGGGLYGGVFGLVVPSGTLHAALTRQLVTKCRQCDDRHLTAPVMFNGDFGK